MASFKLLLLFTVVSFLSFATTEAQDYDSGSPTYLYHNCSINKTTAGSACQLNIGTLFSSLISNDTANSDFHNARVSGMNPSDTVYGLFMCRGDVPSQLCRQCVFNATQRLSSQCSLSKEAVIWYDECTVRYSNRSFFSTVDRRPRLGLLNTGNISDPERFMPLLFDTMNQTADRAAYSLKKYATDQAIVSESQSLYCLAQCTQDLSPQNCRSCLSSVIGDLNWCCIAKQGGRVLYPSCNVRYELYPFYRPVTPSPTPAPAGLVPETNTSDKDSDSKYSEDPIYLSHNCSSEETSTVGNSAFPSYLRTLLSYLSSNATGGKPSKKDQMEGVYGLFMCRGDLSARLCGQCVQDATYRIYSHCRFSEEAIIWYSHCLLRYSSSNFFSTVDTSPMFRKLNITSTFNPTQEQNFFTFTLSNALTKLADVTGDNNDKYKAESLKLNALQTLYTLAQCTPDLSSEDCSRCLKDVIGSAIPWARLGSAGGRVLYPSCNLRFELFQFYRDGDEAQPPKQASPSPSGSTDKRKRRSRTIILIVVPTCALGVLLFFGYYLLWRKKRKSYKTILVENFGHESAATLEPLQFELAIIERATNNFSHENLIGKGGFGEVYKGILLDGRQVAVKRLSISSKQGANEFKNEVLLIAKLQHRNLVAFIGFCLEKQEKILVYEYVPNKSLDYFLFDTTRQKLLSWFDRYNIIGGIARGILYLHEYSRLKVIHRDLKPSNILLDENMIPKISDFGLARIVEINQDQGSTNRIVGTYGYMSPEYAMLGQFSEKSDVFSFGVMVLEIISGKRNASSYDSHHANSLLSYVWRLWRDQTPLSILDPNIKENYSKIEVIKCIQLGLLCVQPNPDARPTMAIIVSSLNNHSIELPTPEDPTLFLHTGMDSKQLHKNQVSINLPALPNHFLSMKWLRLTFFLGKC